MNKDIFACVYEKDARRDESQDSASSESYCLLVGSPSGGKSCLIKSLRNASTVEEAYTPTVGYGYSFFRNPNLEDSTPLQIQNTVFPPRELAHVWELGGGGPITMTLSELINIPITPQRIQNSVVILALDVSKPGDLCHIFWAWHSALRRRMAECVERIKSRSSSSRSSEPNAADALDLAKALRMNIGHFKQPGVALNIPFLTSNPPEIEADFINPDDPTTRKQSRVADVTAAQALLPPAFARALYSTVPEHPDLASLSSGQRKTLETGGVTAQNVAIPPGSVTFPTLEGSSVLPPPVLVVATKWDSLATQPSQIRIAVQSVLRYFAFSIGATLCATSISDKRSLQNFQAEFFHYSLGMEAPDLRVCSQEAVAPPFLRVGSDSLRNIRNSFASLDQSFDTAFLESSAPFEEKFSRLAKFLGTIAGNPSKEFVVEKKQYSQIKADMVPSKASAEAGVKGEVDPATYFTDELTVKYPDTTMDSLRYEKHMELLRLQKETKEKERRLLAEQRANAKK